MSFNGIINVYKEKGYTSFDVVAVIRKTLKMKKVGHTGTLDPDATGVLPICLGKGTKVVDLLTNKDKTYKAEFITGFRTDTQDVSGKIMETLEGSVDFSQVKSGLEGFLGEYHQVPPMYSALKHKGKKLYELAREGITIEREARLVHIYDISDIQQLDATHYSFSVTCSKGTYIRTLIDDLGVKLGVGATMSELERTQVGPFAISEALKLAEIKEMAASGDENGIIQPVDSLFMTYPEVVLSTDYEKTVYNGNKLPIEVVADTKYEGHDLFRIYDSKNRFIALYKRYIKNGEMILKVEKMFY